MRQCFDAPGLARARPAERAGARRIFAAKVRDLAARDQLSQASAMIRARAQHPDEFAAAYG